MPDTKLSELQIMQLYMAQNSARIAGLALDIALKNAVLALSDKHIITLSIEQARTTIGQTDMTISKEIALQGFTTSLEAATQPLPVKPPAPGVVVDVEEAPQPKGK